MMTKICKAWTFDSAHCLPMLPEGHKCKRMHGHTYRVEVTLAANPKVAGHYLGMVFDYDKLDEIVAPVLAILDHHVLNEIPGLIDAPTTEILAAWLWERLIPPIEGADEDVSVEAIRVYESSTTWAEVNGPSLQIIRPGLAS